MVVEVELGDFSTNTPAFKIHYHFINAPPSYSTSKLFLTKKNWGSVATLQQRKTHNPLALKKSTYYTFSGS